MWAEEIKPIFSKQVKVILGLLQQCLENNIYMICYFTRIFFYFICILNFAVEMSCHCKIDSVLLDSDMSWLLASLL